MPSASNYTSIMLCGYLETVHHPEHNAFFQCTSEEWKKTKHDSSYCCNVTQRLSWCFRWKIPNRRIRSAAKSSKGTCSCRICTPCDVLSVIYPPSARWLQNCWWPYWGTRILYPRTKRTTKPGSLPKYVKKKKNLKYLLYLKISQPWYRRNGIQL